VRYKQNRPHQLVSLASAHCLPQLNLRRNDHGGDSKLRLLHKTGCRVKAERHDRAIFCDASPPKRSSKANWLAIKLQQWKEQPLPIKLGIAEVTTSILAVMAAVWALIFAVHQTRIATETLSVSLKAIKFQNAAVLLDPGNDVIERMRKKKEYVSVLKNESSDANTIAEVDAVLDTYQLQIFKASILKDNDLLPDTLWTTFVGEFCNLYRELPYFRGWWGRMRGREPFASQSLAYRELSYNCGTSSSPTSGRR